MNPRRSGFALVLSMVLVLALAVLGVGVAVVATREVAIAGAVGRRAQAVRTAEAGVLDVVEAWSTRSVADLAIGDSRVLRDRDSSRTTVTRVDTALFVVRGEGRAPGPGGSATAHVAALVRTLDPVRLAHAFPGALTAEETVVVAGAGTVAGTESSASETGSPCEAPGPGLVAPAVSLHPGAVVSGHPAIDSVAPFRRLPTVDPFGPPMAGRLADVRYASSAATPRPSSRAGLCERDSVNWGSQDPGHPCHDLLPVVAASGLTVVGGQARAVLTVDGDLTLQGGVRFDGVVVVRGRLTVDGGSVIRGAARARSAVVLDGSIIRDGCVAQAAISAPSLDQAFRPPDRWWIPVF